MIDVFEILDDYFTGLCLTVCDFPDGIAPDGTRMGYRSRRGDLVIVVAKSGKWYLTETHPEAYLSRGDLYNVDCLNERWRVIL